MNGALSGLALLDNVSPSATIDGLHRAQPGFDFPAAFPPFIVPAAAGACAIRPRGPSKGKPCATIKAFVRTGVDCHAS